MKGFSHDESAANFVAVMRNLEDGVLVHREGRILEANPALLRLLGHSAEALRELHVMRDLFHPEDVSRIRDRQRQFERARRSGITEHAIARMRTADGGYLETECMGMSVVHGGQPANLVFVRDTRARREMERMVLLSERLASVGMLAAGIAHELNNPLAYVLGNLNVVIEELQDLIGSSPPERMRDLLDAAREAQQGAERARRIVRGLKSFSRVDAEERTPLDLRAVIDTAINMTANDLRHKARVVRDLRAAPLVEADESRMLQVVVNLLVNASQALPAGRAETNTVTISLRESEGFACLEVRDTGPGISEEHTASIFDPFFTTKESSEGTGLGLAICQGIVVSHGGTIEHETPPEGGALFRVRLPSTSRPSPKPPRPGPKLKPDSARILVIDDEEFIGRAVMRMLRGHDVVVESLGERALARIEAGERFDVILCDLMMPRMTGMELYDRVGDLAAELQERFVFMTGNVLEASARDFLERLPNQSLEKPFDMRLLRQIVRSLTRR